MREVSESVTVLKRREQFSLFCISSKSKKDSDGDDDDAQSVEEDGGEIV